MKEIAGVCSNTFKILIVDDIPLNLLLLDKMLKPFEFQLVKASNGREALHAIQERLGTPEEIDLAIVDLMMPDIDGYKVIEVLRNGANDGEFNIPAHSKEKLPIVILSGMNFSEDIKAWLGAWCANQFVTKPVVMAQLYSTITEELTKKIQAGKCQ
ncbi:response regulator [Leyella stercorea]|uniref:response regulator n=1 Tax=Leyella stercorea TaxID=363265 RepID=UPI002675182A|nr:response regulator [Leyella stercorea]